MSRSASMIGNNTLSSPIPNSPTSLPPPVQLPMYNFVNGQPTQPTLMNGASTNTKTAPSSSQTGSFPPPGSPFQYKPQSSQPNGSKPTERRSSTSFPSPLAGAPVLTPRQYNPTPGTPGLPQYNGSMESDSRVQIPPPSPGKHSSPLPSSHTQSFQVTDHAAALPPAATGLSPTKHSPPRPSTSNGDAINGTPSALPPIAPLLPSSPVQNLSPPVKPADPEHARQLNASMNSDQ